VRILPTPRCGLLPIVPGAAATDDSSMHNLPSLNLSAREHLDLIRRLDREHRWENLSDERYCNKCHEIFCAGDLEIVGGTRAFGPLRLQCPTAGCSATPDSWLPVANRRTGMRSATPAPHGWPTTLRKFAARLNMLPVPLQRGGILCNQSS
jgi:hypothetical protein